MTVDLEDRLRASLHREADRAPLRARAWSGRQVREQAPARRPWLAVAASVVLVAGGAVAVAWAIRTAPDALQSTPPSVPDGDEFPIVALDPTAFDMSRYVDPGAVRPGSLSVFEAGDFIGFAYVGLDVTGDAQVAETNCVGELVRTLDSCAEPSFPVPLVRYWGWSSDAADGSAWWVWTNVPQSTSYVRYEDAGTVLWQEPISGVVVFPNFAGDDEHVVAVDEAGVIVATADHDTIVTQLAAYSIEQESADDLSPGWEPSIQTAGEYAAVGCMNRAGALEPGVDIAGGDEIWNECLHEAGRAAEEQLAEVDMFDEYLASTRPVPSTEPSTSES